jgi:hypothetical protein
MYFFKKKRHEMNKKLPYLSLSLLLLSSLSSYGLECSNISGQWHGSLGGKLTNTFLSIDKSPYWDSEIRWKIDGGYTSYGFFDANCTKKPDGTLSFVATTHFASVDAEIHATVTSSNTMEVTSFNLNSPLERVSGSGKLTK